MRRTPRPRRRIRRPRRFRHCFAGFDGGVKGRVRGFRQPQPLGQPGKDLDFIWDLIYSTSTSLRSTSRILIVFAISFCLRPESQPPLLLSLLLSSGQPTHHLHYTSIFPRPFATVLVLLRPPRTEERRLFRDVHGTSLDTLPIPGYCCDGGPLAPPSSFGGLGPGIGGAWGGAPAGLIPINLIA